MKKVAVLFSILLLLVSCSTNAPIEEEHKELIESYGWSIKGIEEKEVYVLPEHEELVGFLNDQGLDTDELQKHSKLYRQFVMLREKCLGEKMEAVLYSNENNEIVGAQLIKEAYTPGVSALAEKKEVMQTCKQ